MWVDDHNQSENGGFLNSTQNNVNSPAVGKKGGARRLQSVVPLVIRQIRDCEGDLNLFGIPVQILTIVGILKDYEIESTKASYTIEDHTGSIKAVWWLENEDVTSNLPAVKEGSYVQVFGSIRNQDDNKNIMVLRMFLVENCDIITSHLLQVIHVRLEAENLSKNGGSTSVVKQNNPGTALANSMSFMEETVSSTGLTPIQERVFKILKSDTSVTGLNRQDVIRQFPQNQQKQANAALEFLANEGHAYTTIDAEHFKSTDLM